MACGLCASIKNSVTQNCVDIAPISFSLTDTTGANPSLTLANVYQSLGGAVTAAGVINVQGTLTTVTDVTLTFQLGTVTVGTLTVFNVTDGSTWGFSELTPFDNMDVTISNNSSTLPSVGTLEIVLVLNS